ncbi:MAG: hypothetical protein RL409_210 [Gemmatimonadota bacterium]|jgi:hypothetical protein
MLLDEITNYLAGAGLGLTVGTNLWMLPVPETADQSIIQTMVLEYGGRPPLRAMGPSLGDPVAETPRFNVGVIGQYEQFQDARQLAEDVYQALDNLANTTLGATRYLLVRALQPPIYLAPDDEDNEHHFSINFEAVKERS